MVLGPGNAFNKETDNPDEDLDTTYEEINYETEPKYIEEKKPIFSIVLKYKEGQFDYHLQVEDFIIEIRKITEKKYD